MDMLDRCVLGVAAGLAIGFGGLTADAAPITYQGMLHDGANPAEGLFEMQFALADSPEFGIALQFVVVADVDVNKGLFEVEIEFDDVHFDGSDRWLAVRVEGEILTPRTKINYAPYAIRASHADHADVASDLEVPWVVVSDLDIVDATSFRGTPIRGHASSSELSNPGVLGETDSRDFAASGVLGRTNSDASASTSAGVRGINGGGGFGVRGESSGIGVSGRSTQGTGVAGEAQFGTGVHGLSQTSLGIRGYSMHLGGVIGTTLDGIYGVRGEHTDSETYGMLGTPSYGVEGFNVETEGEGTAIYGEGGRIGVQGVALPDGFGADLTRIGVDGFAGGFITGANMIYGVRGFGQAPADGGSRTSYGVYGGAQVGNSSNTAYGVFGEVFGPGSNRYAGFFQGDVHVAGTLSKSSGSFKIDHPMDPENKYLSHSFVESPEMINVYSGVITLDEHGGAVVELPDYFDSLNKDFRYQLTAVGAAMPELHVASLIEGNSFAIGGGAAGMQVSWEVSGVRKDASALYRPIDVESDKRVEDRGLYLDPEAFGFGRERAIHRSGPRED